LRGPPPTIRREPIDIRQLSRQLDAGVGKQRDQHPEIVGSRIVNFAENQRSLEELLRSLLRVKSERVVIDIAIVEQPLLSQCLQLRLCRCESLRLSGGAPSRRLQPCQEKIM
jgi:hypothetical protein